jgi:hypothetical protein
MHITRGSRNIFGNDIGSIKKAKVSKNLDYIQLIYHMFSLKKGIKMGRDTSNFTSFSCVTPKNKM